jgi:hypothetical protein
MRHGKHGRVSNSPLCAKVRRLEQLEDPLRVAEHALQRRDGATKQQRCAPREHRPKERKRQVFGRNHNVGWQAFLFGLMQQAQNAMEQLLRILLLLIEQTTQFGNARQFSRIHSTVLGFSKF